MKVIGNRHCGVLGAALSILAASGAARGQWTTNGNDAYFNLSGRCGVGTTSPSYKLHALETSGTDGTRAIYGLVNSASGVTNGVYGQTSSATGRGVIGVATATSGDNIGTAGNSSSTTGRGVNGYASATSGFCYGVFGECHSTSGTGVLGWATATSGAAVGVDAESDSTSGAGVYGLGAASTGTTYGVLGEAFSGSGFGVYSIGNFGASGTKNFRIDHPADPANKYLLHYSIESSEVLNSYSGKVALDGMGCAVVDLPAYFASVNTDPRYTLTAVGAPMPLLYVATEISEAALEVGARAEPGEAIPTCSFRIAGGAPGGRVSWRVEAVRNDRWVRVHGAPVEVKKPESERGTYQNPELFGQPRETGTYYGRRVGARELPENKE